MDKVREFLDAVRNDLRAQEMMKAMPAPKNDMEAMESYVKIAKELGFDLTSDEILAGLKGMTQEQKAQTGKVSLDDADVENVAGGAGDPRCADTFDQDEWCWFSDSCSYLISFYDDQPANAPLESPLARYTFHGYETEPEYKDDSDIPYTK